MDLGERTRDDWIPLRLYEIWIENIETISDTRTTRVHMGSAELAIYSEASRKSRMIMDHWSFLFGLWRTW